MKLYSEAVEKHIHQCFFFSKFVLPDVKLLVPGIVFELGGSTFPVERTCMHIFIGKYDLATKNISNSNINAYIPTDPVLEKLVRPERLHKFNNANVDEFNELALEIL